MTCICGPEWRNPDCDVHGNARQECVAEPSGIPGQSPAVGRCVRCGYSRDGHWVNEDRCPEFALTDVPAPRCTWVLATTGRCTNPAINGDVCAACEDARDKRRD